ncbi:hypothetical protein JAAARDRAFT_78444 [Jaapia argillacea MUCL 33604]|uniref:SigF-like NTF2-like domain-containing protein n=1 Tax=Jaapia argillacea MUCL 33604 TaxID=933084 RepID=A0A067PVU6_9AGAM|nr:hypothetical protein JAAARDRAFT_78444 [Jaapia argillacea MUCL 33604]
MERPAEEIERVIKLLVEAVSPEVQLAAVQKYFTPDAEFRHPICQVVSGPNSREDIVGIFQWYRIMSPKIHIDVNSTFWNPQDKTLVTDSTQVFHIRYSLLAPAPARLLTRIQLREIDGLYYISKQEDFYHPEDLANLVVPPLAPIVRLILSFAGLASNVNAAVFQILGFWRPSGCVVTTINGVKRTD